MHPNGGISPTELWIYHKICEFYLQNYERKLWLLIDFFEAFLTTDLTETDVLTLGYLSFLCQFKHSKSVIEDLYLHWHSVNNVQTKYFDFL